MTTPKKSKPDQEFTSEPDVFPITVTGAYPWQQGNVRQDAKWAFLRNLAQKATEDVEKRIKENKKRAGRVFVQKVRPYSFRAERLRAGHGNTLIDSIMDRIKRADILLVDIADRNPNVLFELGCGVAYSRLIQKRVFILDEVKKTKNHDLINKTPSDLQGMMFSFYYKTGSKSTGVKYTLKDATGFHAALRSAIIDVARIKNMWIDPSFTDMEDLTVN